MKAILWIALTVTGLLACSCNTFIGIGRDMRLAGEGMEKTAHKAQGGSSTEANSGDTSGAPVY